MVSDERNDVGECPVCYEPLQKAIRSVFPCSHEMCFHCLMKMVHPLTCPMCRRDLSPFVPDHFKITTVQSPTIRVHRVPVSTVGTVRIEGNTRRSMLHALTSSMRQGTVFPPRMAADVFPSHDVALVVQGNMNNAVSDVVNSRPTTNGLVASIRMRPLLENDLLHARVTRRSVFLRT